MEAEPVVTVTALGVTVSVPASQVIFEKKDVRSCPSPSRIRYPSPTGFSLLPASVWLPPAAASQVKPSGSPAADTSGSVSACPSYTLDALPAVRVTEEVFSVTSSFPRFRERV